MLAELAVVEPDDQAQPGVETAGGKRGVDVGLVVVMHQRQRGGLAYARLGQDGRVESGGLDHAGSVEGAAGERVVRAVDHGVYPAEQGRDPCRPRGAGPPGGRYDHGDPFPVHSAQFGGQPFGERVITGHDHVSRLRDAECRLGQDDHGCVSSESGGRISPVGRQEEEGGGQDGHGGRHGQGALR